MTIADCDVQTKRGSGKGGQNRNKRDTAVRIVHPPSGAVGESQEQRSQLQNKRTAFVRMANHPRFKLWLNNQLAGIPDIDPRDVKTEVQRNGDWVTI